MAQTPKFGLVGWQGERLQAYFEYCTQNKLDQNKLDSQVVYILYELKNDPRFNSGALANSKSVEEAVDIFTSEYLKIDDTEETKLTRRSFAYDALERFGQ